MAGRVRALQGDLGQSIATGRPVSGEIAAAALNTFVLAGGATLIGFTAGATLGFIAGVRRGTLTPSMAMPEHSRSTQVPR